MKKRLLSLLVAISMVLTFLPVSALTAAAEEGSSSAKLEIEQGGYPKGSHNGNTSCSGNDWSYDKDTQTLTLSPSTPTNYDFSNKSIHTGWGSNTNCNIRIGRYATVTDGVFLGAVTNNGTIIGGFFYSSVTNESDGIIENGQFGDRASSCTVTNNGGTINGGTFKEEPTGSGIKPGYTLKAKTPTGFEGVLVNEYRDSCYIIPNQASVSVDISYHFEPAINFQNLPPLDVTIDNAPPTLLSDWCGSDPKIEFDGRYAYNVTFTAPPANGSTVTISPLTRLVIDENGYPVGTKGGTRDYSGNGWNFENGTLTLTSGDYSFWEQSEVKCPVIIKNGVTTIGGMFSKKVTNYGTVKKAVINNIFENHNTVKNSYFFNSLSSIAVTNHGGTMLDCLFENAPEGIESHTITEVEDYFISAELDGIDYSAVQTKFYFTGFPTVRVNLVKDGKAKPVTSINQKLNYGGLIEDSSRYPVGYIFTVENDNEDVVLNQGTYPTLKMASNGTPIIDGAYYSTIESNIPTYFGDGWHCQKAMDSVGTLYLEKGTYDFRSTDPVNKNGEPLNAVICSIVNEGGTIEDGTFSKPIVNGQLGSTSSEHHEIEGGTFAAGLLYNDGVITGGAFNGKDSILTHGTVLSGNYRSVTVNGGAIVKVNDTLPLVYNETTHDLVQGSAWDLYSYAGTVLTVEADADITNINGQEIGNAFTSYYPNGETNKKVVRFEMPDSDVELNSTKIVDPDPKPEPKPEPEPEAPTYTLTVKGGTFTYNGGEAMTSANVPVDAEVKVTLNQSAVPEGMVFDLWAMDEASLLGNPAVAYNEESFTIPAGTVAKGSIVTVEAQYRDATIESEPSILGTAAIIGVAGAGTAVIVWQGYRIGMELYEKYFQPTPEETAAEQPAPEAPAAAAAS